MVFVRSCDIRRRKLSPKSQGIRRQFPLHFFTLVGDGGKSSGWTCIIASRSGLITPNKQQTNPADNVYALRPQMKEIVMKTLIVILITIASMNVRLRAGILVGPVTNSANGHLYFLLTATNWPGAEREAVSLGGHLTTINDAAENQWIFDTFSTIAAGTQNNLLIGLNDLEVEGTHVWVSGEESTYRNWAGSEPNNANGGEDYVLMYSSGSNAGKWNDFQSGKALGVVEIVPGIAARLTISTAVEITWETQTTNRYQIQWATSIDTNNWFNMGDEIQGNGSTLRVFDSMRNGSQKFYRVLTLSN